MVLVIIAFLAVFLLVAVAGLLLSYRNTMVHRIGGAIDSSPKPKTKSLQGVLRKVGASIGGIAERFKHVLPKSEAELSVARKRLIRAGFRSDSSVNVLRGSKVLVPLLLCLLAVVTGWGERSPFIVYLLAVGIGFLAPDFWLDRRIKRRQSHIRRGLPDVLDMLVICTEAGLSLDQATARTADELSKAQPDLCDELSIVVLEQRAGRSRSDAWKQMADRTDVESIRSLVSTLVQSERFGTSVAKTMRTHADTLRVQRTQAIEEKAAKTHVKLVFPLVLCIFPSLFVVVLAPAIIKGMEAFKI